MEKNYFVIFEGIDGCGKDTQIVKFLDAIRQDNKYPFGNKYSNVWVTREPTKITYSGKKISEIIREREVTGEEAAKLFVEDRKEHSKVIRDILLHSHVICSRYDLSTMSYQMGQGLKFDKIYNMHEYFKDSGCLIADITIIVDLDVDTAMERISGRKSKRECFENKELQEKVRENLLYCAEELKRRDGRKIIIVDGSKSEDEVAKEIVEKVSELIDK